MRTTTIPFFIASVSTFAVTLPINAFAEEVPEKYRETVAKGLDWLAHNQYRDGHWEANQGEYHSAMTALAGTALLMEGSTLCEGKYQDNIRRAVDWLTAHSNPNGLIGDPYGKNQWGYMYGHGFSILFLSQLVGEEDDPERRRKLHDLLTRAVDFTCKAQTSLGGWGYVSAKDLENVLWKDRGLGAGFDEGSTTITQVTYPAPLSWGLGPAGAQAG